LQARRNANVSDKPLDLSEFAVPPLPSALTPTDAQIARSGAPPFPTFQNGPTDQPGTTATFDSSPTRLDSSQRSWKQNQLAIAGMVIQQMLTQNVMPAELAARSDCTVQTIENLMTGNAGNMTLDKLAQVFGALGAVPIIRAEAINQPKRIAEDGKPG
jgi:hypothetical protein